MKQWSFTGLLLLAGTGSLMAVNVIKLDTTSMAADIANWSAVPATTDVGEFDATPSASTLSSLTLGGINLTLGGLQFDGTMQGAPNILSGNTLTLGTNGIDMSAANQDVTINCTLANGGRQTWNVQPGRTLSLGVGYGVGTTIHTMTGGGSVTVNGGIDSSGSGDSGLLVTSGSLSATGVSIRRSQGYSTPNAIGVPGAGSTTAGFYIGGSVNTVTLGTLTIGLANSGTSGRQDGGATTVSGTMVLGKTVSGSRYSGFHMNGGTFTSTDPVRGLEIAANGSSTVGLGWLYLTGGTSTFEKICFGASADTRGGTGYVTLAGGTLYLGSGGLVRSNTTGLYNANICLNSGLLGATADWSTSLSASLNGSVTIQAADSLATAHNITLDGALSGTGSLTKTGNGILTLGGANTYSGSTVVSAGTLATTTASTGGGAYTVTNASSLNLAVASPGSSLVVSDLTLEDSTLNVNVGGENPTAPVLTNSGSLNITGSITVNVSGTLSAGPAFVLVKYSPGSRSGGGSFVLGTLPPAVNATLDDNTVTGEVTLTVAGADSYITWVGGGSGTWDINNAANLVWKGFPSLSPAYYQELLAGSSAVQFDDTTTAGSPVTVNLNTNVSPNGMVVSNAAKNYVLTGTGGIGGTIGLTKSGTGTLTLSTANAFSGGLNLNGGATIFSSLDNLGSGDISFDGGILQYNGNTDDISVRMVTLEPGGATIDTGASSVTFANPVGNGGAGGLIKLGSGTLTLSGINTYNGNTLVSQGTLALLDPLSLSNSAAIVVSGGATLEALTGLTLSASSNPILAGTGTIKGFPSLAAGGRITPGTNGVVGTLTFGTSFDASLSLDGGTLVMDVSNSTKDFVKINGGLYLNSGTIQLLVSGSLSNGNYRLLDYDFLYGGDVGNLTVSGFSQPGQVAFLNADYDAVNFVNYIELIVTSASSANLVWAGDGSLNYWDIGSSVNWLNGVTPSAFNYGDVATFDNSGSTSPDVNLQTTILAGGVNVNASVSYRLAGPGKLSGATGITKSGTGTLTILTANNNLGPTVINAGTLQVGDGFTSNAKIGSGNITNNAALAFLQPEDFTLNSTVSGSGSLTQGGGATLTLGKDNTYSGPTTISTGTLQVGAGGTTGTLGTGPVTNDSVLVIDRAGTLTVNNAISGIGSLTKKGTSTVTLAGANSYQGNTVVEDGTLKLGTSGAIPSGGGLVLNGSAATAGIVDLNALNLTVGSLSGTSSTVLGQILNDGGVSTNTLAVLTDATLTYAGLIRDNSGSGGQMAFALRGTGVQTLTGTNSYSGGTLIDGARLNMGGSAHQQAIGTGLVTLTNGGQLQMNYHNNSANNQGTFVNAIWVPAGTTGTVYALGRGQYTGNVTVNGTLDLVTSYVRSTPAGDWSASDGQINITGASTGNDVYLSTTVDKSFGTAAIHLDTVDFFNSANYGTAGVKITLGALSGNSASTIFDTTAAGGGDRVTTYEVGGRNSDATFSGTIRRNNRTVAINKVGTGTWTLEGTNTYNGTTTISAGTLRLGNDGISQVGSISNSPAILVSSNATFDVSPVAPWSLQAAQTLGGFGSVTGAVQTITGTTLRPGGVAAAGTLTFQSALVADSANLVFDVADVNTEGAGTNDLMVVNGPLTLSGTNVVNFNFLNGTPTLGVPYTLINYTGGLTGGAGNLASASGHINVTFNTAGGKVTVTFNSIGLDLVWRGDGSTNAWRSGVVSNWFNGTAMDLFFANDRVLFDDTATNYGVALAETVLPASVRVNTSSNYSITGAGKISGSTSLLKEGTGTLTLATVNDYLGGTTNTGGGTLDITNQFGALGSGALVMDGSTLLGHVSGSSATLLNSVLLVAGTTNTLQANGAGLEIIGGALSGSGHARIQSDQGTKGFDLAGTNTGFAGVIELATPVVIRLQGAESGSASAIWDLGPNTGTILATIAGTERTLSLGALRGASGQLTGHLSSGTGTNVIWQIGALGLNTTFAGTITDGNQTGGPNYTALDKIGAGTLALSGNATHTGPTAINGGTLQVDGSWSGSPITVVSGALGGNGTISSTVDVQAGGTLAPGASVGLLTVNSTLSLAGNTVIEVDKITGTNDQVVVNSVNYGGMLTVLGTGTFAAGDSYQVFSAGTPSGNFTSVLGSPGLGLAWDFNPATGVLSVVGAAPTLNYTRVGNVLQFNWGGSYKLQSQTNALNTGLKTGDTNWFDYPAGATSPVSVTNNPAHGTVFFRLATP